MSDYYCKNVPAPSDWKKLQLHPFAEFTTFTEGMDLKGMIANMKEHGYDEREPVVLVEIEDGTRQILDGRHKIHCAKEAGVTPTFVLFQGPDPLTFILKKDNRQHLGKASRSLLNERVKLARKSEKAAAAASKNGSDTAPKDPPKTNESQVVPDPKAAQGGSREKGPKAALGGSAGNGQEAPPDPSQKEEAKRIGVSPDSLQRAAIIESKGIPQLKHLVENEQVSIREGARIAELTVPEQKEAVKAFFCDRCFRGAWNRSCPQCAEVRKKKPKTKKPPVVTNGEPVFDFKTLTRHLANVLTEVGKLARQHGLVNPDRTIKETGEFKEIRRAVEAVRDRVDAWRKTLGKK